MVYLNGNDMGIHGCWYLKMGYLWMSSRPCSPWKQPLSATIFGACPGPWIVVWKWTLGWQPHATISNHFHREHEDKHWQPFGFSRQVTLWKSTITMENHPFGGYVSSPEGPFRQTHIYETCRNAFAGEDCMIWVSPPKLHQFRSIPSVSLGSPVPSAG